MSYTLFNLSKLLDLTSIVNTKSQVTKENANKQAWARPQIIKTIIFVSIQAISPAR